MKMKTVRNWWKWCAVK